MRTRTTTIAAATAVLAAVLVGCSSGNDSKADATPKATKTVDNSNAEQAAGIPPKPTGAKRAELLRALAAANPDIVKYEDKAIDAARNQCSALSSPKADWTASQRFTYKDVTTTEAQGKQINEALKGIGFCKV